MQKVVNKIGERLFIVYYWVNRTTLSIDVTDYDTMLKVNVVFQCSVKFQINAFLCRN
jgi:hypothetical protein